MTASRWSSDWGSQNNDPIRSEGYVHNSHGGLLGGITTGMPLVFRVGFKPTSTINKPQQSVRKNLEEIDFELEVGSPRSLRRRTGWRDVESRVAIELMNAALMHQSQKLDKDVSKLF